MRIYIRVYIHICRCISVFRHGKRSPRGGSDSVPASRGRGERPSPCAGAEGMRIPRLCGRLPAQWSGGAGGGGEGQEGGGREGGRSSPAPLQQLLPLLQCRRPASPPPLAEDARRGARPASAGYRALAAAAGNRAPARSGGRLSVGSSRSLRGSATGGMEQEPLLRCRSVAAPECESIEEKNKKAYEERSVKHTCEIQDAINFNKIRIQYFILVVVCFLHVHWDVC